MSTASDTADAINDRWIALNLWIAAHPTAAPHLKQIKGHSDAWLARDLGDNTALEGYAAELAGAELDASHYGYAIPGAIIAPVLLDDIPGGQAAQVVSDDYDAAKKAILDALPKIPDIPPIPPVPTYVKVGGAIIVGAAVMTAAKIAWDASPFGAVSRMLSDRKRDAQDRNRR